MDHEQKFKKEDVTVVDTNIAKKTVFATSLGNAMEWFDFGIYAYLAVTIGKVFFSEIDPSHQLIYSLATFAIAFIARPIGGLVFGMMGDRIGRKKILSITLIMMAIATLSIGLIPSYSSIGIYAPILLIIARLIQGFSTGGEYAGAMTFIAESTPDKKRGFMASGLEVGTLAGFSAGAGLVTFITFLLGPEKMVEWGWRIPFLIAGPLGFIGLYFRTRLEETPAFEAMIKEEEKKHHTSLKEIVINHWKPLLICIGIVLFYNTMSYMVLTYMPAYLTQELGYGETKGLVLMIIVMIIMMPIILTMGHLSDRIGRNRIIKGALIGVILLSVPAFMMIGNGNSYIVFCGLLLLSSLLAAFQGALPATLPSLFFTKVRYGSLAITYNISTSLFGGTTPLVIAWLVGITKNSMLPAYYLMTVCLFGLIIVSLFVKETAGKSLRGSPPVVKDQSEIQELLKNPDKALWWKEEVQEMKEKGVKGNKQGII
ncbi:glycine betaine/L-proline transporter ProP [Peribacillus frigoritolerans]|uniref:glycine betaine/L-proline transporter ProP n=1 Tax=Peribacillus frigoritolerans TaxID=450367 RepID=UPI002ED4B217|nr:glycine betaine/L-proline transporter ProP [Peribacillus frigoritolerans]